jgi:hypothetical protein
LIGSGVGRHIRLKPFDLGAVARHKKGGGLGEAELALGGVLA